MGAGAVLTPAEFVIGKQVDQTLYLLDTYEIQDLHNAEISFIKLETDYQDIVASFETNSNTFTRFHIHFPRAFQ